MNHIFFAQVLEPSNPIFQQAMDMLQNYKSSKNSRASEDSGKIVPNVPPLPLGEFMPFAH